MKINIANIGIIAAFLALGTLASCDKKTPQPNNQNEEFDAIKVNFIKLESNGTQTTDTTTVSFNASGVATPANTNLTTDKKYRTLITLYSNGASINHEIIEEASEHKFFFFANPPSGVGSYTYNDGIGLDGVMEIKGSTAFNLQILLRHGLNKNHADAQAYNSPNYQNAGGDNDLNINFNITPGQ
ncbi:hypothetical protein DBR32_13020 [Taibaiella sp. KBW10]|uniref:hypothetical protein n=1 Tax=Taibaiella sp. KBW10 TaxID=2153357 RepID=UPI000F5A7B25|nr:hypothetical protein [Taibaiella sp. KBW10]RQO30481.1 hypothetical protein DBR32_13020 [Taibaiella sp. KBW10]